MSELEDALAFHICAVGLPLPKREYRFHPTRKWRFDFSYPQFKIALECEGGTWAGGRHTRGAGFERDCEKYNEAALLGWTVLRFTSSMINDGRAIAFVERALEGHL